MEVLGAESKGFSPPSIPGEGPPPLRDDDIDERELGGLRKESPLRPVCCLDPGAPAGFWGEGSPKGLSPPPPAPKGLSKPDSSGWKEALERDPASRLCKPPERGLASRFEPREVVRSRGGGELRLEEEGCLDEESVENGSENPLVAKSAASKSVAKGSEVLLLLDCLLDWRESVLESVLELVLGRGCDLDAKEEEEEEEEEEEPRERVSPRELVSLERVSPPRGV